MNIPPLVGCLICHTEGQIQPGKKPTWALPLPAFQFPTLTCGHCGAMAYLDVPEDRESTETPENWRIRYRKFPDDVLYRYARMRFKKSWWDDKDALDISTDIYVQRHRLQQVQAGFVDWLKPAPLKNPPAPIHSDEVVYLILDNVAFGERRSKLLHLIDEQDTGRFYLTDKALYLIGKKGTYDCHLKDIEEIHFSDQNWFVYYEQKPPQEYPAVQTKSPTVTYSGSSQLPSMDAEIVIKLIKLLRSEIRSRIS